MCEIHQSEINNINNDGQCINDNSAEGSVTAQEHELS